MVQYSEISETKEILKNDQITLYWTIVTQPPLFPCPEAIRGVPGGRRTSQRAFPGPQTSPK